MKELIQLYYLSHVILTKFSAIEQFESGIASIYLGFCERTSYEAMRMFLETNNAKITLDQFLRIVSYQQLKGRETESNLYKEFEDYVFEFELFLADVHSGAVQKNAENVTLEMILEFCTGTDRVSAFGFHKNIEVYVCQQYLLVV